VYVPWYWQVFDWLCKAAAVVLLLTLIVAGWQLLSIVLLSVNGMKLDIGIVVAGIGLVLAFGLVFLGVVLCRILFLIDATLEENDQFLEEKNIYRGLVPLFVFGIICGAVGQGTLDHPALPQDAVDPIIGVLLAAATIVAIVSFSIRPIGCHSLRLELTGGGSLLWHGLTRVQSLAAQGKIVAAMAARQA
jgi:hypothetical protein